jgi:hypothetical protein
MPVKIQFEISDQSLEPFKDLLSANAVTLDEQIKAVTEATKEEIDGIKRQRLKEYLKSILIQQAIVVNIMGSVMQAEDNQDKKSNLVVPPNHGKGGLIIP